MSRELKVGAFVLVSVAIFLATFMYVASVQVRGVRIRYKTYFKYAGGVDPGSPVRFGGMKAGTITAIHPSPEDPTKIEVLFEIKQGVPVNADSVAMLTSLSPLGDKYLEITTGTNKARRLPGGATIPSTEPVSLDDLAKQASAVIPTVQSTLQDVQKDIDQLTGDARVVLANFQSMTGPQNQRNLALRLSQYPRVVGQRVPANRSRSAERRARLLAGRVMRLTRYTRRRETPMIRFPMRIGPLTKYAIRLRRILRNCNAR